MSANPFDQQKSLPGIRHIVAVGSGKGGVGKSTVSANLAVALASKGHKVGLLDADIYGPSQPRLFGALHQRPEVDESQKIIPLHRFGVNLMSMGFLVDEDTAAIWRGPMLFKAMDQFFNDVKWGELDYLLIDLPPGTGDIPLTLAQKVKVSGAVTVCTPQNLALVDAKKAIDLFGKTGIPHLGVVENMAYFQAPGQDEPVQLFPKGELDEYLMSKDIPKLAQLPFSPSIGMASEMGIPLVNSERDSAEAQAYLKLAEQINSRLN